jgi:plasmid stabilization system protein ParE
MDCAAIYSEAALSDLSEITAFIAVDDADAAGAPQQESRNFRCQMSAFRKRRSELKSAGLSRLGNAGKMRHD